MNETEQETRATCFLEPPEEGVTRGDAHASHVSLRAALGMSNSRPSCTETERLPESMWKQKTQVANNLRSPQIPRTPLSEERTHVISVEVQGETSVHPVPPL